MTDYSEGGARLEIGQFQPLPQRFNLAFDGFEAHIACEVRFEDSSAVGVEFVRKRGRQTSSLDPAVEQLLRWLSI